MTRTWPTLGLTSLAGTIERRLLINYRVDPDVAAAWLPAPFSPALVDGHAIAGICVIQLRVRPAWMPPIVGARSINGAHRIAVTLPDGRDAVYIPRRDTNSRMNVSVGGRLFPGVHHLADISLGKTGDAVRMQLSSRDDSTRVAVTGSIAERLPETSIFDDVQHVSDFFEAGSLGFSDTATPGRYDGLELATNNWSVTPLDVTHVESTLFDDHAVFPSGSVVMDNALLMEDIDHAWHRRPSISSTEGVPADA